MAGERDLKTLLSDIKPELQHGIFVFCTISEGREIQATIRPLLTFREREGTTLVVLREEAESLGLSCQFESRLISLTVHSSLDAVGFLAVITARLAEAGISVNAVSAFYHDHLFVPAGRADEALALLQELSTTKAG
ncbi:MAG TPA: ACT domain-containing protein [Bradyrhizobium sp.]|uniref:ACT domain-containing protein n=1 Tax=Bradyrhizobium sp. TaxID=376 RepID=UPI002B5DEFBB|nr:ACT domain-containing protein [Bradyrhizobium sp.]HLZ03137.1 ACT domain-containing protein [Bradyrhizobium sp.]